MAFNNPSPLNSGPLTPIYVGDAAGGQMVGSNFPNLYLAAGSVTQTNLGLSSVGTAQLQDGSVTAAKLVNIQSLVFPIADPANIISGLIFDSHISPNAAIQTTKLIDGPNFVLTYNNQIISGNKTFQQAPRSPSPTTGGQVANKDYVDYAVMSGTGGGGTTLGPNTITSVMFQSGVVSGNAIGAGAILAGHLSNNSISNARLQSASVSGNALAANSILAGHLSDNSIQTSRLQVGSISGNTIGTGAILAGHLSDNSIQTSRLQVGSISGNVIGSKAILNGNLASASISGNIIGANSILAGHLATNIIANANLQSASVSGNALSSDTVNFLKTGVTTNSISTSMLQVGSISGNVIAIKSILTDDLADNIISYAKMQQPSVSGNIIGTGAILTGHLSDNSIQTSRLQVGSISGNVIANKSILTDDLADNIISYAKMQQPSVSGNIIANQSILTGHIANNVLTNAQHQSASISGNIIAMSAIGPNQLGYASVLSGNIAQNSVGYTAMQLPSVSGNIISSDTVNFLKTAGSIPNNFITNAMLQSGVVSGNAIGAGAILAGHLSDNSIQTSRLQVGSISGNVIGFGAILNGNIALASISGNLIDAGSRLIEVASAGSLIGTEKRINFIPGPGITFNITDNTGSQRLDVIISGTSVGGSSSSNSSTISGSGTIGYISKFNNTSGIVNSVIYETAGNIGINTIAPTSMLSVNGSANLSGLTLHGPLAGLNVIPTQAFQVGVVSGNTISSDTVNFLKTTGTINNNFITTAMLQVGSVSGNVIANKSILTDDLADNIISYAKMQQPSVSGNIISSDTINFLKTPNIQNNSIGTSALQVGSVSGNVIAMNAIGPNQLGYASVLSGNIAPNSVGYAAMQLSSVSGNIISSDTVTFLKTAGSIPNNFITNAMLQSASISGGVIATQSILEGMIGSNSISTRLFQNGVVSGNIIGANSILTGHLTNNLISTANQQTGSTSGSVIAANSILTGHLSDNSIQTSRLQTGSISGIVIAMNAIGPNQLGYASVLSGNVAQNSIGYAAMQLPSVSGNILVANSILTGHLSDNSIQTSRLQVGSVSGNVIATPGISNAQISSLSPNFITNANLQSASVSGNALAANSILAGHLTNNLISTANQQSGSTSGNVIAANSILAGHLATNIIANANLQSASVSGNAISSDTVNFLKIATVGNNAITNPMFQSGSVSGNAISSDTVNFLKTASLGNNSITNPMFQSGVVSGNAIGAGAILAGHLANGVLNSVKEKITQAAHGFSVGNVIYYASSVLGWQKAQANNSNNAEGTGVVDTVIDTNNFSITYNGHITGLSGINPGGMYWIDPNVAGNLTPTEPVLVGQISRPMLQGISSTDGIIKDYRGFLVTSGATTASNGASSAKAVNQVAHGFAVGNAIYYKNGPNGWQKANAGDAYSAEVLGIVSAVADSNNFTVTFNGYISGLSGVNPGGLYFLDPNIAGNVLPTEPMLVGQVSKPLYVGMSPTEAIIKDYRGSLVTSGSQVAGTLNFMSKFGSNNSVTNSTILYDTGTQLGLSTTTPTNALSVNGNLNVSGVTLHGNLNFAAGTSINGNNVVSNSNISNNSISTSQIQVGAISGNVIAVQSILPNHLAPQNYTLHRNLIINGNMNIWQRLSGSSISATGTYSADRYKSLANGAIVAWARDQGLVPANTGSFNSLKTSITTAASGQTFAATYQIEGYDIQQTVNQNMTLSFWAYTNVAGKYYVSIQNGIQNRSYVAEYQITTANTWQKVVITFPWDSSQTWWTYDNSAGMRVNWLLGSTANTQQAAPSLNTWLPATYYNTTSGVGFNLNGGNFFNIAQVQLEVGDQATPFEFIPYQQDLARCQRYFQNWGANTQYPVSANVACAVGYADTTGSGRVNTPFPVEMRITPTLSYSANADFFLQGVFGGVVNNAPVTNITNNTNSRKQGALGVSVSSTLTIGLGMSLIALSPNSQLNFNADF